MRKVIWSLVAVAVLSGCSIQPRLTPTELYTTPPTTLHNDSAHIELKRQGVDVRTPQHTKILIDSICQYSEQGHSRKETIDYVKSNTVAATTDETAAAAVDVAFTFGCAGEHGK